MSSNFGEATLLAYVEQTMSAAQVAEFEAAVAGDPRLLASLRRMQADCESLRSIPDELPPATLVADVLATIERSMLIESDLMAPPIDMRRYRASHWQRYAAAAGFTLLLGGGGFMLFQTLRFQSSDEILAPHTVAGNGTTAKHVESVTPAAPEVGNRDVQPWVEDPHDQASSTSEAERLATFEAALSKPVEPEVIGAIEREWPADLDLFADVIAADPAAAFESVARRLRERGGDLIVNATLNVSGPARSEPLLPNRVGAVDPFVRSLPNGISPTPVPLAANPVVTDPEDRVPIADQSRYAAQGYQFTLLGTPSDILSVLRELGADRSLRVFWARQGAGRMLVDLVAPNLPPKTRWDRVMFWWVDPADRFDEARSVVAQASTEPFIRIPVRIHRAGNR